MFQTDRRVSNAGPTILYLKNTWELISFFDQPAKQEYISKR